MSFPGIGSHWSFVQEGKEDIKEMASKCKKKKNSEADLLWAGEFFCSFGKRMTNQSLNVTSGVDTIYSMCRSRIGGVRLCLPVWNSHFMKEKKKSSRFQVTSKEFVRCPCPALRLMGAWMQCRQFWLITSIKAFAIASMKFLFEHVWYPSHFVPFPINFLRQLGLLHVQKHDWFYCCVFVPVAQLHGRFWQGWIHAYPPTWNQLLTQNAGRTNV